MSINTGAPSYSSTAGFILDLDALVEEAFERCGLQDRTGYELKTTRRSINLLIAEWANRGLNLWTIQQREATVVAGTQMIEGTTLYSVDSAGNATADANDSSQIIDIDSAVMSNSSGDFSMTKIGRSTYWDYTVKSTQGRPSQYYFERTILPKVYFFPEADSTYTFKYYTSLRMTDINAYTKNAQIPFRFLPCMVAGLAYYVSMKYAPDRIQILKTIYDEEFSRAASQDVEKASYSMVPRQNYIP
jgi:hypothetical protein|tara:strand:- start:901 stop:1635 length:735 start_codon:yes stop_codon:yes gene_type:complete